MWTLSYSWQPVIRINRNIGDNVYNGTEVIVMLAAIMLRRVWRYQRGHQNPYIGEEQTTQWPKEKVQKDKQRSTKHTYKTTLKSVVNSGAPEE